MPSFLKLFFIAAIIFTNVASHAQCVINKKNQNNVAIAETPEKYEYLRTGKQYYGLSVKTIARINGPIAQYVIAVKYTGDKTKVQPLHLNFKLADGYLLAAGLKFIKNQKVDGGKVITNLYEILLKGEDVTHLKQTPLKEIDIVWQKNTPMVVIPVDDETFVQNQLSCLQSSVLN